MFPPPSWCGGFFGLFFVAVGPALAQTETTGEEEKPAAAEVDGGITIKRLGVLFASASDDPEVFAPVRGGKKVVLAAGYEWEYGVRLFSVETWRQRGYQWEKFLRQASREADKLVESIEPLIYRDSRGVIQYAELASDDPFLSSVLLSKRLLPKFRRDLGARIHAVIIDRYRIYLFPADAGKLEVFGSGLVTAFQETERPVSLEVFLIDENGAEVVGEISD